MFVVVVRREPDKLRIGSAKQKGTGHPSSVTHSPLGSKARGPYRKSVGSCQYREHHCLKRKWGQSDTDGTKTMGRGRDC
jgi:hypothetical protein